MEFQKLAGIGLTALRSNLGPLKKPYKLTFSITYMCQSRCVTCNIWQIKPKDEMSIDEIREFAKKNTYFRWLEITGGEPFLRSDIVDIVKAFSENNRGLYLLTMPTNSLCNPDMVIGKVEQILRLNIPKVVITLSLDGYREMHDKIRGIPGNFDKVMNMYRRIQALKNKYSNLYLFFGYTISKFNQGQFNMCFDGVKKELPEITYNDFHINVGQLSDIYYSNTGGDFVADRAAIANEVKEIIRKRERQFNPVLAVQSSIENAFLKGLVDYVNTGKPPMRSRSLDASLFMDSFGNVYPSIMWGRKVGNIKECNYSLDPIWGSKEAEEIRALIKNGHEPCGWTACEAYQTIAGNVISLL
jgi:MoaA/NifB/PqqE/SkfB family radical SAM enzyme